jgi:hypothetical protein
VIYSWNLKPEMIEQAMAGGARGYLSGCLPAPRSSPLSQAVLWGMTNGFRPDTLRTIDPALLKRPPPQAT